MYFYLDTVSGGQWKIVKKFWLGLNNLMGSWFTQFMLRDRCKKFVEKRNISCDFIISNRIVA